MEPIFIFLKPLIMALPTIIGVWFIEKKYIEVKKPTKKDQEKPKAINSEEEFQRWKAERESKEERHE